MDGGILPAQVLDSTRRAYQANMGNGNLLSVWKDRQIMAALGGSSVGPLSTTVHETAPVTVTLQPAVDALLSLVQQANPPVSRAMTQQLLGWQQQWPDLGNAVHGLLQAVLPQQTPKTVELLLQLFQQLQTLQAAQSASLPLPALPQWLHHMTALIVAQPAMPAAAQAGTDTLLQFLQYAARERPNTFEHELFALPVFQKAGFSLSEYVTTAAQVDPLRVALLVIAADTSDQGAGTPLMLHALRDALRTTLARPENFVQTIAEWEQRLQPSVMPIHAASTRPMAMPPQSLQHAAPSAWSMASEGMPQPTAAMLPLQAVSRQQGVLPADAWQVAVNGVPMEILEWQGSAWVASSLVYRPKTRAQVRAADGQSAWLDLLSYWFREGDEELAAETPSANLSGTPYDRSYDSVDIMQPLFGAIAVSLSTPMILTRRYREQTVDAPLQMSFQFLADLVDPKTRYSRTEFLRLAQSPTTSRFRASIRALGDEGLPAYAEYVDALAALFAGLPCQGATLTRAHHFLRDEVLLYLMGKSHNRESRFAMLERLSQGDLLASVCATTAGALAAGAQTSDALIHFADATEVADSKPFFMQHLEKFLRHVRQTVPVNSRQTSYHTPLPIILEAPADPQYATPLAQDFVHHLAVV